MAFDDYGSDPTFGASDWGQVIRCCKGAIASETTHARAGAGQVVSDADAGQIEAVRLPLPCPV